MSVKIVQYWLRRATAAEFVAENPVLNDGEIGLETDTKVFRMGDGVTAWNDIAAIPQGGPAGEDGVPGIVKVEHGTDPDVDRPDATIVYWVGSALPNNADPDDFWKDS